MRGRGGTAAARRLPLRPYEPNTRPPFCCLSRQFHAAPAVSPPGGRLVLFIFSMRAVPQASSVDPYLSGGDVHAATFQRGFAGRIGETHLHPGLKLRCSPDSDRWKLPSAVVRFNRTAEVHKQKHARHLHVGTRNLPPPNTSHLRAPRWRSNSAARL